MLKSPKTAAALILLASTLPWMGGCDEKTAQISQSSHPLQAAMDHFVAKLDRSLSDGEREILARDGFALAQYNVDGAQSKWFAKIFGGNSSRDVLDYLDTRVKHLYSERAEMKLMTLKRTSNREAADSLTMMAHNAGPLLWFLQAVNPQAPLLVGFNDTFVPLTSSRSGIVVVHPGYFASARPAPERPRKKGEPQMVRLTTPIVRTSTLVHEARHSDCQGGLGPADLTAIRRNGEPVNAACGHLHGACPTTFVDVRGATVPHPFAGELLCDQHPWGAYGVEMIFAANIAKTCKNCSETERQEAQMLAVDASMRLSDFVTPMLKGERGDPDMSSQGLHP